MTMRPQQFDPFGEPDSSQLKSLGGGSRAVEKIGIGAFWTLVLAIVATRVAYFDAGLDDTLRFMASVVHSVCTALV